MDSFCCSMVLCYPHPLTRPFHTFTNDKQRILIFGENPHSHSNDGDGRLPCRCRNRNQSRSRSRSQFIDSSTCCSHLAHLLATLPLLHFWVFGCQLTPPATCRKSICFAIHSPPTQFNGSILQKRSHEDKIEQ